MQIKTNLNSVRCKAVNRSFISMQLTIFLMDYPNAPLNPTPVLLFPGVGHRLSFKRNYSHRMLDAYIKKFDGINKFCFYSSVLITVAIVQHSQVIF